MSRIIERNLCIAAGKVIVFMSCKNKRFDLPYILADDLTGACDIAGCFLPIKRNIDVLISPESLEKFEQFTVLNTQTRTISEDKARAVLTRAAKKLSKANLVFKKIDTALRGNVGAEIETLSQEIQFDQVIVAPSIPAINRVTVDGVQLVDGIAISNHQYAKDPVNPIKSANIADIIRETSLLEPKVFKPTEVSRLDSKIAIVDSQSDEELDEIVLSSLAKNKKILFIGSLGLGSALCRTLLKQYPDCLISNSETRHEDISSKNKSLLICGTKYKTSFSQIENAQKIIDSNKIGVDLPSKSSEIEEIIQKISEKTVNILYINQFSCSSDEIPDQFAKAAINIISQTEPENIGIIGGETAYHVLKHLGVCTISICGVRDNVVSLGKINGGRCNGCRIALKGGSVGSSDAVIQMIRYLVDGV